MKRLRAVFFVLVGGVAGFFVLLAGVWLYTLQDSAPAQNDCAFKSIGKAEFQRLLARAKDGLDCVAGVVERNILAVGPRNQRAGCMVRRISAALEDAIDQLRLPARLPICSSRGRMRSCAAWGLCI